MTTTEYGLTLTDWMRTLHWEFYQGMADLWYWRVLDAANLPVATGVHGLGNRELAEQDLAKFLDRLVLAAMHDLIHGLELIGEDAQAIRDCGELTDVVLDVVETASNKAKKAKELSDAQAGILRKLIRSIDARKDRKGAITRLQDCPIMAEARAILHDSGSDDEDATDGKT